MNLKKELLNFKCLKLSLQIKFNKWIVERNMWITKSWSWVKKNALSEFKKEKEKKKEKVKEKVKEKEKEEEIEEETELEMDILKNNKISLDQKISELNGEIGSFKNYKNSLHKKVCELNGVINDLKKKIITIEKAPGNNDDPDFKDDFEEFKEKFMFSILKLKKDIEGIKGINNDLNTKLDSLINEIEKVEEYFSNEPNNDFF